MPNTHIKLKQIDNTQILYHYTKSNGINGIINHSCFWATKSDFLNDPNEFLYIRNIILSVCEEYIEDESQRELFLNSIMEGQRLYGGETGRDYFVLSFSCCSDSITMWSEFGSKTGYNIAFGGRQIVERIQEKNLVDYHGYVIYSVEKQKRIMRHLMSDYIPECLGMPFARILEAGSRDKQAAVYREACKIFCRVASVYAMFFKHEAFAQEQEYRFVFRRQDDTEVLFRVKDGFIIPYIEIPISPKLLPIKRIMVAPENHLDLARSGIEYLLKYKGYQVEVVLSDIKLRY